MKGRDLFKPLKFWQASHSYETAQLAVRLTLSTETRVSGYDLKKNIIRTVCLYELTFNKKLLSHTGIIPIEFPNR